MRYLAECGSFIREYWRHFHTTGAILPSSRFLARALVSELRKPRGPATVLEVGPGTGSVTREIIRHLRPGDHLDVVEINEAFVALLRHRFDQEPAFRDRRGQVELIHVGIEDLIGDDKYDFIISGLPLNNFSVDQVRAIFRALKRLLKPGGTLSYFEYIFIRHLATPFASRRERRRLYRVGRVVERYIESCQTCSQQVLMNVPPAVARHLCLTPKAAAAATTNGGSPEPANQPQEASSRTSSV